MKTQRIQMIDGVRGLCLLGILSANMLIFQYGIFGKDRLDLFNVSAFDEFWHGVLRILVEGSFMPIFAFLFGFGMIKLSESLERRKSPIKWTLFRRSVGLMILGCLHGLFLWEGDILLAYGLSCVFLILFVKRKKKTILIWAIVLFVISSVGSYGSYNEVMELDGNNVEAYVEKVTSIFQSGTYGEILNFRQNDDQFYKAMGLSEEKLALVLLLTPLVYGQIFLIGMYAAKARWFTNLAFTRKAYLKWAMLFIPFGILSKIFYYVFADFSWTGIFFGMSSVILPVGYIFLITYGYTKLSRIHPYIEAVGRLSLTNYLLHSVICTFIFYGYGLGLFGKLGVFNGILLSFVIYTLLALLSRWYLRHWKIGPMERILRMLTYLSFSGSPKRKENSVEKTAS